MNNLNELVTLLNKYYLTLSSAESLTGGLFAQTMTEVKGASKFYKGGFVTYMTEEKVRLLGISYDYIDKYGVVSQEIAMQMASNDQSLTKSDLCVSFTGNAGPDAMENKPVGLVYIGIAYFQNVIVGKYQFSGSRNEIRKQCVNVAIDCLIDLIKKYFSH